MNLSNARTDVLKEPRGFIKIIQFFFSILAFACLVNWRGHLSFKVKCTVGNATKNPDVTMSKTFQYPFAMDEERLEVPDTCVAAPKPTQAPLDFEVNAVNDSQFFVFVGVMSFLASILICAGYVLYEDVYLSTPRYAWGDILIHGVLAFLWFVSSCAYAASIWKIKKFSSYAWVSTELGACGGGASCTKVSDPTFANLDIAALCGFVNVFLWGANIWFLYKEARQTAGSAGVAGADGFPGDMQDSPSGVGGGGYEPYGPGPGSGVGGGGQWGAGQSAVQGGMNEI